MYLVGFFCVVCFLLAQRTESDLAFVIFAVISGFCAGMMAWYFSDEDREV